MVSLAYDHFPDLWLDLEVYIRKHTEASVLCADKAALQIIGYQATLDSNGLKEVTVWEITRQNFEMTFREIWNQARVTASGRRVLLEQMVQRARNQPIPTLYERLLEDSP